MNRDAGAITPIGRDRGTDEIIKLAVFAVGGQGGGVLNGWIVDVAERNGQAAQATSVAGVAQRTGATLYYVEMMPERAGTPVFALSPGEGDVDILIAAELMEAGRAIMRGFVTPDRTTLIASSHRALAVSEKIVPGTGIAEPSAVLKAARERSREAIIFDMESMAVESGSVISASLFGALAGSGRLPFPVDSFHETIRASGRGVEASLKAFDMACEAAQDRRAELPPVLPCTAPVEAPNGPAELVARWSGLVQRADALPGFAPDMARAGLRKLVEYQDLDYADAYLARIERAAETDSAAEGAARGFAFTETAAKYLANAMAYDDIIRVADLKTRSTRVARVDREMGATDLTVVHVTEYVHPGAAEVVSLMPAAVGRFVERRARLVRLIDRAVNRGRRIRTDRIGGFALFHALGGLRRWRRSLLRHAVETAHINAWWTIATARLPADYDFAVATLRMRRLIKGYSDTHARGLAKYDRVMAGTKLVDGRDDAAAWTERLITAALADPEGDALDGALDTIRSFATPTGHAEMRRA